VAPTKCELPSSLSSTTSPLKRVLFRTAKMFVKTLVVGPWGCLGWDWVATSFYHSSVLVFEDGEWTEYELGWPGDGNPMFWKHKVSAPAHGENADVRLWELPMEPGAESGYIEALKSAFDDYSRSGFAYDGVGSNRTVIYVSPDGSQVSAITYGNSNNLVLNIAGNMKVQDKFINEALPRLLAGGVSAPGLSTRNTGYEQRAWFVKGRPVIKCDLGGGKRLW
jgi:hypothetical protein